MPDSSPHWLTCVLLLVCLALSSCADQQGAAPRAGSMPALPASGLPEFASIPEGFPADVPIYPDATILSGEQTDAGFNIALLTEDNFTTVTAFYRDRLDENGWAIITDDEIAVETKKILRVSAVSASLNCTVDISPVVGDDGGLRGHGIIIDVTEKDPAA